MTVIAHTYAPTVSRLMAAELRAEMGRQAVTKVELAKRLHVSNQWVTRRLSTTSSVQLTLEEVLEMAEALGVSAEGLILAVLPRLDSNQQPSGYVSRLVRAVLGWFLGGLHRCTGCGLELDGDDPNERCEECVELDEELWGGDEAEVVELAAYRTRRAA